MSHQPSTGFVRESRPTSVNLLHSCLPTHLYEIFAVTTARIYHSQFSSKHIDWSYSGLRGVLAFGRDKAAPPAEGLWFRLIDSVSERVIWVFKIPRGFVYEQDRPFFYAFSGMSRKFGFLFSEDDEATKFAQQVALRTQIHLPPITRQPSRRPKRSITSKNIQLSPSLVASPTTNTFVHLSHIGMNSEGRMEHSKDLDPVWGTILADMTNDGGSREDTGYESQPELTRPPLGSRSILGSKPTLSKKPSLSIWRIRRMKSKQQTA